MSRRQKGNTRAKNQSYVEGTFIWFQVNTLSVCLHTGSQTYTNYEHSLGSG